MVARARATEIVGISHATALAADDGMRCALDGGRVVCWGHLARTERGRRVALRVSHPVTVPLPAPARFLRGGHHLCAAFDRDVQCWWSDTVFEGGRAWGLPEVGASGTVESLVQGGGVDCATMSTGEVWCVDRFAARRRLRELEGAPLIESRGRGICARRRRGPMRCWDGNPDHGRPWAARDDDGGDAYGVMEPCRVEPGGHVRCGEERVPGLDDVREMIGGDVRGCARRGDGRVLCWGADQDGALTAAEADRSPRLVPFTR